MKTSTFGLIAALLVGCGGSSKLEVKLDATFDPGVSDAVLGTVTSFAIAASGDQVTTDTIAVTSGAKREQTLVFVPLASTRLVTLTVTASNAAGDEVAKGTAGSVEVVPNATTSENVTLGATTSGDMGVLDLTQ